MGRRKQQLIAHILRRLKHMLPVREEHLLRSIRETLGRKGSKVLSFWAHAIDEAFDDWDEGPEDAAFFIIVSWLIDPRLERIT